MRTTQLTLLRHGVLGTTLALMTRFADGAHDGARQPDARYLLATTLTVAMLLGGTVDVQREAVSCLTADAATALLRAVCARVDRCRHWCRVAGTVRLADVRSSTWRQHWTAELPLQISVRVELRLLQSLCERHEKDSQVLPLHWVLGFFCVEC